MVDALTVTAYHEAGHAVGARFVGWRVGLITIVPNVGATGQVSWQMDSAAPHMSPEEEARAFALRAGTAFEGNMRKRVEAFESVTDCRRAALALLCGPAAELRLTREGSHGGGGDVDTAVCAVEREKELTGGVYDTDVAMELAWAMAAGLHHRVLASDRDGCRCTAGKGNTARLGVRGDRAGA